MATIRVKQIIVLILSVFLLFSFLYSQDKKSARIKFLIGKSQVLPNKKTNWQNARLNMAIMKGDRIKTFLNSRVELDMPDGSLIKINENTIFDVKEIKTPEEDNEDNMSFTLWAGNIWAKFKKVISTRQTRQIESPSAVVAIRGTTLEMDVDQKQTTLVRVYDGQVAVTSKDVAGEVVVGTNQESSVERGKAPTKPRPFTPLKDTGDQAETGFVFQVNTSKLQYKDPAVLAAGVPINGRVTPGASVTANGIPLNVNRNGNFSGRVRVQEGLNEFRLVAQKDKQRQAKKLRFLVNTKRPQIQLSKPITAGFINRRDYSLNGAVFDPTPRDKIKVFINDELVTEVFGRGSFNRTIILNEGKNIIRIAAVDISKNRTEIAEQIFLDTVKPIITVTEPAQQVCMRFEPPPPPRENQVALVDAERFKQQIRGLIIDPQPSSKIKRIAVNGKEIQPNSDGSFETTIVLQRGENRLSFYAEDLAGNITRSKSRVIWVR